MCAVRLSCFPARLREDSCNAVCVLASPTLLFVQPSFQVFRSPAGRAAYFEWLRELFRFNEPIDTTRRHRQQICNILHRQHPFHARLCFPVAFQLPDILQANSKFTYFDFKSCINKGLREWRVGSLFEIIQEGCPTLACSWSVHLGRCDRSSQR